MRNFIYLVALTLLGASCSKKDSFYYGENAGLHFGGNLKSTYNFAAQFDPKSSDWDRYFYGDSLTSDTLIYRIDLLGEPASEDRLYYLKTFTMEGQDPQKAPRIEFQNPYTLNANSIRDTIKIIIYRPETRGVFSTGVMFDFDQPENAFEKGVTERSVMEFEISNRYNKPNGWNEQYFGEYSEEKHAFFVTVLHKEFDQWMGWMFDSFRKTLIERLKEYNAAHPDNPKDFTFPG